MVGLLTKTVIRSPVARWILQARIRRKDLNDVVFVGDDFIHVKQVQAFGHLEHVATKANFDARIRAATIFTIQQPFAADDEDVLMKLENGDAEHESRNCAPQCLVLTLDSSELLFVCLREDGTGGFRFIHQSVPLPRFEHTLFQPGEHIAVDPHSRALAVAANEREVVIYQARLRAEISRAMHQGDLDWRPVSSVRRPLQVDGLIQHMEFLRPAIDDAEHIILLLIIGSQRRTRAVVIDWYLDTDIHQAHIHPSHPIDVGNERPLLLIPLRNTSCLLVTEYNVRKFRNILSGSAECQEIGVLEHPPLHPGSSPRRPMWANWCRPRRVQAGIHGDDHIYLVREDGVVLLLEVNTTDRDLWSHAGDLDCHVSSAFASLGDLRDPDILIAAGDMSSGQICSIGHWSHPTRVVDLNRREAMKMELVEPIPAWASVTDMATSTLATKSQRARDGIFVTSGRQPHGTITELRQGLEARLAAYTKIEGLQAVTDVWALPLPSVGRVLIVLATPSDTRLYDVSPDFEIQHFEEIDGADVAFDTSSQTLVAVVTANVRLVQVTRTCITTSPGLSPSFEDVARLDCHESTIIAATVDFERFLIVTGERSTDADAMCSLKAYTFGNTDENAMDTVQIEAKSTHILDAEPLCLTTLTLDTRTIVFTATPDCRLHAWEVQPDFTFRKLSATCFTHPEDQQSICDSMTILSTGSSIGTRDTKHMLVCGLRDGRLLTVCIETIGTVPFGTSRILEFGQSAVKLTKPPGSPSRAYATSGLDTCLLSWDGRSIASLKVQSIWISDKWRAELSQESVVACTHIPKADVLSSPDLAESLVLISDGELLITKLDSTPTTIPRQIGVKGTPNRLIYAEEQRCLVCASTNYDAQHFPSTRPHAKPEERRQIWSVIDFIPFQNTAPSFSYPLQPGERIYGLLEWSYKSGDDKRYSFILATGSYTRSSGSVRGRITFLQPRIRDWIVVGVKEAQRINFDDPVYAITLLDDITYAACVGSTIVVSRFLVEKTKWEQLCEPLRLASPGVYITSADSRTLYISTAEDSFITLDLKETSPINGAVTNDSYHFKYRLECRSSAPRADALLSHVTIPEFPGTSLATTKYRRILGLQHPLHDALGGEARLDFEACLPRSLTRVRRCNIRPPWKPKPVCGENADYDLIGCATDGSLVGMSFLNDELTRRLSWLQRLCEWSEELCPHSYESPPYNVIEHTYARDERAMPIGFGSSPGEVIMRTSRSQLSDVHIDGDILARLLENGGAETLRRLLEETAQRQDAAGEWMRRHFDGELEAVDEVIGMVETLLDAWL